MERPANLLADLDDARFGQHDVHHALEALPAIGIVPVREHRTPERILAWIDAEFGGTWSSEAAAGGIWIAEDAEGPVGFAAYDPRGLRFHWLRTWAQRESVGIFGPIGVSDRARGRGLGTTLVRAAMFSLRERGYRQALIPIVRRDLMPFYEHAADARLVESVDLTRGGRRARTVIMASGNGSNFQAVAEAAASGDLPLEIAGLVVNRAGAYVRDRARSLGIGERFVSWNRGLESREEYDVRVLAAVASLEPELVLMLGWMHVLPATFVARFPESLNVHPAFLPLDPTADAVTMPDFTQMPVFRGAHAVDDAIAADARWVGASVHRVGVAVDRGDVFARAPLRRVAGESREDLDRRLHACERDVVGVAVRRWAWERR